MKALGLIAIAFIYIVAGGSIARNSKHATDLVVQKDTSKTDSSSVISCNKNMVLAFTFYEKDSVDCDKIPGQIQGIDFTRYVRDTILKKCTRLIQWTYLDRTSGPNHGKPIIGGYFTFPGADPAKLGIPLENRVKATLILEEDTRFLCSTIADIEDWNKPGSGVILKGGGVQLFQRTVNYKIERVE